MPTIPLADAGQTTEPSVSVPTAAAQKLAATAAPEPELEPQGLRMAGTDVGPLAEIGLAQNDGSGGAQLLRDKGVSRRARLQQGQRPRRGQHAVSGVYVVFDEYRNTVHGAPRALLFAFLVEGVGDG
jgi:hypothetical protein